MYLFPAKLLLVLAHYDLSCKNLGELLIIAEMYLCREPKNIFRTELFLETSI